MTINRLTGQGKCEDHIVGEVMHGSIEGPYLLIYRELELSLKDETTKEYKYGQPNDKHLAIDLLWENGEFQNRIAEVFIGGPYNSNNPRIITTKKELSDNLVEAILSDIREPLWTRMAKVD